MDYRDHRALMVLDSDQWQGHLLRLLRHHPEVSRNLPECDTRELYRLLFRKVYPKKMLYSQPIPMTTNYNRRITPTLKFIEQSSIECS